MTSHIPAQNAPCYSNPDGVTHSFEKDINGRMICVMRTYSIKAARIAKSAPELLAALELLLQYQIDSLLDDDCSMDQIDDMEDVKIARTAIKKAKG